MQHAHNLVLVQPDIDHWSVCSMPEEHLSIPGGYSRANPDAWGNADAMQMLRGGERLDIQTPIVILDSWSVFKHQAKVKLHTNA